MKTDIEIAQETTLRRIDDIAKELGIDENHIEPYGRYIAKVSLDAIDEERMKRHNLILVTAISPTKAGIGKTTVSVGLALGLNKIGKKAVVALREPSLGPCFGMKGGACGGGYAQLLPMDKINLHFTGDFHAITTANNMIAALLDNYLYQHAKDGFRLKTILWKRVLDVNDRSLRQIITGLGPLTNGIPTQTGFDITPASEIMGIMCFAKDIDDLKRRIGNILLGFDYQDKPFYVRDMGVRLYRRTAEGCPEAKPRADNRGYAGNSALRAFRQYSAWMQLGRRYEDGPHAWRLRHNGGRLRCRSRRREVLRHQVPHSGVATCIDSAGGDASSLEDAWRRCLSRH